MAQITLEIPDELWERLEPMSDRLPAILAQSLEQPSVAIHQHIFSELDKLSTFEEILQYGIDSIKLKDDYFFKRIRELEELCAEEDDVEISLESLKGMFLFVGTLGKISKPSSLTVSDNGFFYLEWETDENNSITLRFKKDDFCDYVIFQPSSHLSKRIILNGSMYVLDLINYLNNLKIAIHQDV